MKTRVSFNYFVNDFRHLALFEDEKCDLIYLKIGYFIGVKGSIVYVISQNYAKTLIHRILCPWKKILIFHNVRKLIKSDFNKCKKANTIK